MLRRTAVIGFVLVGAASCRPDVEGRASLVETERVLAIRSEPAEAAPGASVSYTALYVSPQGEELSDDLEWDECSSRKPLSVAGAVHPDCLAGKGEGITAIARGAQVEWSLDSEVCRTFGPTPPEPEPNAPPLRAADPDTTGGFYQPVIVRYPSTGDVEAAVGVTRLSCGIGAATIEQTAEYNRRYRPNTNPSLAAVYLRAGNARQAVESAPPTEGAADATDSPTMLRVAPGKAVKFEVEWPTCPSSDECGDGVCGIDETVEDCASDCTAIVGCGGAERYLLFDADRRSLVEKREHLTVSWYANRGTFEQDRSAPAGERSRVAENQWVAPTTEGVVTFWVVIRDDRRGAGWRRFRVGVEK
jgi:hypothetical protein